MSLCDVCWNGPRARTCPAVSCVNIEALDSLCSASTPRTNLGYFNCQGRRRPRRPRRRLSGTQFVKTRCVFFTCSSRPGRESCRSHEDTSEFEDICLSQLCLYHIYVHIYLHKVCLRLSRGLFSLVGGSCLFGQHFLGRTTVLDLRPCAAAEPHGAGLPPVLPLTVRVEERRRRRGRRRVALQAERRPFTMENDVKRGTLKNKRLEVRRRGDHVISSSHMV